jgi:hypothetical protein
MAHEKLGTWKNWLKLRKYVHLLSSGARTSAQHLLPQKSGPLVTHGGVYEHQPTVCLPRGSNLRSHSETSGFVFLLFLYPFVRSIRTDPRTNLPTICHPSTHPSIHPWTRWKYTHAKLVVRSYFSFVNTQFKLKERQCSKRGRWAERGDTFTNGSNLADSSRSNVVVRGAVPPFLIDLNKNESCPPLHRAQKWCPRWSLNLSSRRIIQSDWRPSSDVRLPLWMGQINVIAAFKTPPPLHGTCFRNHLVHLNPHMETG